MSAFGIEIKLDDRKVREVTADVRAKLVSLAKVAASGMGMVLMRRYPTRTGRLRAGVRVSDEADRSRVLTTAVHANVYEKGSPPRVRRSGGSTGKMPRARVFIPLAVSTRRKLQRDQQAILDEPREIA